MKRLREEGWSQFKRPFGTSRGESYGQPQNTVAIGGGGGQKLTTDDALHYLKEVKEMFQDQREKYEHFLEVMKDFKAQRIDTEGVIAQVKELFKGHNNLIYGFNTFLPKGFEITLDDEDPPPKKVVQFEEAINFVNKIKNRFQDDDQVYKSFLDILNMYRKEHKNISEVYDEVSQLFEDHADLLDEFTRFLPDNSSSAAIHHSSLAARSNLVRYDERSGAVRTSQPMRMDKLWRGRDVVSTSHGDHDISGERPELDRGRAMMRSHKDQRKREKGNRDRRNHDVDDRENEDNIDKDVNVQHLSDKRKPTRKVEGFKSAPAFGPSDDKNTVKSMYSEEFHFCEKVKEKLGPDDYQAFLKCLHIYSTEIITRSELQNFVADLLGKYPDLMEGFSKFLERCENIYGFLAGVMNKKSLLSDGPLPRRVKADDKDKGPKCEIDSAKEKPNEDYSSKSIQELDLSNCKRCTPSYRLLPVDYPIPTASQRSKTGERVLNDYWVSVTSGSEDYSFKHMRRNQYEESLFKCEDDRFELDMLLESVSSTAKKVEELLNSIDGSSISRDAPIHIEEHFTSLNLRCIERLYGDHGLDVMDILRKTPATALTVILTRLKQKQEEWTKCRGDFNKVWAETYAKNHYKSLDHRSFYFKQQDSKNLSTKSLVAEIRELKESMQKEDDMVLAVAAGNKRPLVPHLKFEYSDRDIHEDIYKLIKFSCEEIVTTKEQLNKVMRLWTTFLEPILGVTSHTHDDEYVKARQLSGKDGMEVEMAERPLVDGATINGKKPKLVVDGVESSRDAGTDATTKEHTCKEGSASNAQSNKLNDASVADSALAQNVVESHFGRSNMEAVLGLLNGAEDAEEPISATDAVQPQSKAADTLASMTTEASTLISKASRHLEKTVGQSEVDKEEGETPKAKYSIKNQQNRDGIIENGGLENDLDAENEDSENASEGGDDNVSVDESAGDECSREEHENEEDVEHDEVEGKAESEGEAEVHHLSGDVGSFKLSDGFLSAKPLSKYISLASRDADKSDFRVFYGNDNFYALFRLHRMLYERILTAKTNSTCSESKWKNSKDSDHLDPYASFTTALYNLLDGLSDNAKFEDDCRAIIGNQSYVLFTLDKLIYKLVKQLQAIATDETDNKLLQLYEYERSRRPSKFLDSVYHENARVILHEDNIYRVEFASLPDRVSIQLMDDENEKPETVAVSIDPNFAAYLYNDFFSVVPRSREPKGIMLLRNKKNYAGLDEYSASSKAIKGVHLSNGLECKVSCSSSKISYVLDTEDFLFRTKRERESVPVDVSRKLNQARVHRFNRFLSVASK
ncbi:paired amphipathic helix protein Sin3-like 2 isoform X2 [Silene latifolia]|uniref:paired amphipathic helix protein Sin3-like 2 isoform X2 n=1 Tax=Silene latifolia TaxID=37657 RepID=UPI003D784325